MFYYWYVNNHTGEEFFICADTREESEDILDEYFDQCSFMYCGFLKYEDTKTLNIKTINA